MAKILARLEFFSVATTFSFIETLTIPFWSTNINSFTLNNYIVIQHIHGFRFNDIFLSYYIFIYMQHMFIHNRGQNFFSTRWPHSFNILSRVQNSEIPFPSPLTNLFFFSNIFIFIYIQGQIFSSKLLHIHSTFCIYFLKLQPHVCASRPTKVHG